MEGFRRRFPRRCLSVRALLYATLCRKYGGIEGLTHEVLEPPPLRPGTVRVAVEAAGVSFANTVVIAGKHQNTPTLPFVPGTELSGTVIEIADDAKGLRVGERVIASVPSGAFATEIVADPFDLYPIPANLDAFEAVALPTLYGTTLAALRWRARLAPGQVLLVHGAAGGVGLAAVDLGRALGARVIAVAGSDAKLSACAQYGAWQLIDHRTEDVRARVLEATGGRGADVVYDPVGGKAFETSLRCTAPEGTILVIGFASGEIPTAPLNHLLVKNLTVSGFYWGFHLGIGRDNGDVAVRAAARSLIGDLVQWAAQGRIKPKIWQVFPHREIRAALRAVLEREVIGKVALSMQR